MISNATLHLATLVANILSLIFIILGIIFLSKQIRFENKKLHSIMDLIIISLSLVGLNIIVNILSRLSLYVNVERYLSYTKLYINDLLYINNLAIIPLAAIFIFIAMLFLKAEKE